ncbi:MULTISPECIES: GumC family protein [unclassified Bradyrhizobium]|uniref:GumC family protein n=1 Tax=unclassified Bradyrhizobium TaxID=2631580 RepID=UPI001BA47DE4|nr:MULTISPECIES: GumC family protein [unclassified Bradyrhizobium]MBR1208535.1 GumC family protein [Bradyrhizobium sp. AUGA SZCCT0124]MBR1312596.1 GumC family protein [Bradyrhizobium sp. AUGA SZCCT0051]MBR1340954.1 GumC family protein [Bradyrhizobium sp. AUGA SZCCT0105]MBR1359708.1 GumC family protein [Bradyrhizobium sp. AUGA SZCCT0045]
MKFGSRIGPRRSEVTEPAASWETAGVPAGQSSAQTTKGVLSIPGVVAFFREKGQRILMLAAVIFAVGVILLMLIPARYAATALVVLDPREQRVTADQDVLPGIGQDAAALQSYVEIAKSDGFLGPLIDQLKVAEDSDIAGGRTDATRLLDRFRNRLDISRRGLTYVIAIKFTSNNPQRAAYYANAVAEAFVASQRGTRSVATDEAADWLKSRLKTLNDRLRSSEDAVAKFKLEHRIVNAGKESTTQQLRVTDLTQQVAAARARAEEAKSRYEQLQRDLKANVDGPVKQDLLSALRAQRSALNDQIAQKRGVLGDRHPDLVMALSQLSDLNRQIEIERKKNIETAKSEYEAQRDQQKALEDQLKAAEQQILVDGQALVKLQELQRDADANKNIYEQFLSRYRTTDEQRGLQNSQTKVASSATPPVRSTLPPLPLLLVALAIVSLLTSTAIVAVPGLDLKQLPIKSIPLRRAEALAPAPAAPQSALPPGLPVLARIPNMVSSDAVRSVWQTPISTAAEPDLSPHLQLLIENIEQLPGEHGKVALLLSVETAAGGSTVARSLNRSAVKNGMLSVLIEMEARRAEAAPPQGSGIIKADLPSVVELLGASSKAPPYPQDDIRADFGLIIVDASSLAMQPAAVALAARADLVILVVREGAADPAAIGKARTDLSSFGSVPIALVINRVAANAAVSNPQREALGLAS